jgi:hypothetical protein
VRVEPESLTADSGEPAVGLSAEFSAVRGARTWKEILDLSHDSSKVCAPFASSREEALYLYRFLEPVQSLQAATSPMSPGAASGSRSRCRSPGRIPSTTPRCRSR